MAAIANMASSMVRKVDFSILIYFCFVLFVMMFNT